MIKQTLVLSMFFSPLVATTINMAEFVPTDAQYKCQVEDYALFVRPFVKEKGYVPYAPDVVYAHNQDKSSCILMEQKERRYCSYLESAMTGAFTGGIMGGLISMERMAPFAVGMFAGATAGLLICAVVNQSRSKSLHISVLDFKADKTADRYQYEWWVRTPCNNQLDLFAKCWIEHKCNKGEALKGIVTGAKIINIPQSASVIRYLNDLQSEITQNDALYTFKHKNIEA